MSPEGRLNNDASVAYLNSRDFKLEQVTADADQVCTSNPGRERMRSTIRLILSPARIREEGEAGFASRYERVKARRRDFSVPEAERTASTQ